MFDNSTSHGAFATDALRVSDMNLAPGRKQPAKRDTYWDDNIYQSLVFPENYKDKKLQELPKGMKVILQERGL